MPALELDEPDITNKLLELQHEGWLVYAGRTNDRDQWIATRKGHRLTATKVLKRISAEQGLVILDKLIAEARLINSDPERSQRIAEIYLFGSLHTGSEDGTIGDIDIVVETKRRNLPVGEREKLEEAEQVGESWGINRWSRGSLIIGSRLNKIARAVSLHDSMDLRLPGVRFRQIYAFDVEREREIPFDASEKIHAEPLRGQDTPCDPVAKPFTRLPRPWPIAEEDERATLDSADGYEAQHLWQNGLTADAIGEQLRATPADITVYLASRAAPNVKPAKVEGLLSACVRKTLPDECTFSVTVAVKLGRGWDSVEVRAYDADTFDLLGRVTRYSARDARIHHSEPTTIKTMMAISVVAFEWRTRMKSRIANLYVRTWTHVRSEDRPVETKGYPNFQPLEASLLSALAALWAGRNEDDEKIEISIEIKGPDRSRITQRYGRYNDFSFARVPTLLTAPINDVLRPFRRCHAEFLDRSTGYTVSVNQDMLDD